MARLGRNGFLLVGVIFHLIYIYSIFDIYFVSPIVHGMREYSVPAPAPAKRLFLVVGDGLRADKCFQKHPDPDDPSTTQHLAPFVRSKVLNEGTFGVSHTRVPTESRPGHVALIAGLYEDVSAVTTGWKLNPVNFDSVFNRSRHTWSWGSPDILPMFKHGASDDQRVDAYTYDEGMEDFTQDATNLDIWVFDRVKELFSSASRNATLNEMLHKDKLVFFLHLLGLDTTGHAYRPYSAEYLRNIKVVDKGLAEVSALVDSFYGRDGQTAWVFTADHGMSDWGSHGDGHPDNTRTPLVAWGAGVNAPVKTATLGNSKTGHEDGFSSDWGLDAVQRVDVAQADIAALMAYLVGLEFPVNSVGELPLEYVNGDPATKAKAVWTNTRQIVEMYRVKEEQKKSTVLQYRPFKPLSDLESRFSEIESLLAQNLHEQAIAKCVELMKTGLKGMRYLQTYDWLFLRTLVTLGYLGWIAFALTSVIDTHVLHQSTAPERTLSSSIFFGSLLVAIYSLLIFQKSRLTYYAYPFFPILFWEEVYARRASVARGVKELGKHIRTPTAYVGLAVQTAGSIALMEAMVWGYFYREVFTGCFLLATTWPLFYGGGFVKANRWLVTVWVVICALMSTFTLLPVGKEDSVMQIAVAGGLMFTIGLFYLMFGHYVVGEEAEDRDRLESLTLGAQVGYIGLSAIVTILSVRSLQARQGLPLGNQVVAWLVLVLSYATPFLHILRPRKHYFHRLMIMFLTFSPSFVILTIAYEGLFYVCFSVMLLSWVLLEQKAFALKAPLSVPSANGTNGTTPSPKKKGKKAPTKAIITPTPTTAPASSTETKNRALTLADARTALFFFFHLQIAFFGTGNIASVSSFSLDSVYRLVPIFDPLAMGALLILRLMIPFALISVSLGILNQMLGLGGGALFGIVIAVADVLTLNFFFYVRDEGSWLEIGTGISHFVIAGLLGVFVALLEGVAAGAVRGVEIGSSAGSGGKKVDGKKVDEKTAQRQKVE